MRKERTSMLLVLAALVALLPAALAQDPILLRHQLAEDEVRAIEIVSTQEGTEAGQATNILAEITLVSRARDVSQEGFTEDIYSVDTRSRVEAPGVVLDSDDDENNMQGSDLTGTEQVVTTRMDWRGAPIAQPDEVEEDATTLLVNKLRAATDMLPEKPVAPGDTWTNHEEVPLEGGSASMDIVWRFDRLAEIDGRRYAILIGDAQAYVEGLQNDRKEQHLQVQGQEIHRYVDEFIQNLTIAQTIEVHWDIEAGYSPAVKIDQLITAMSLITLTDMDTGQVMVTDYPVEVERTGTVDVITRQPTDDEVARIVAPAIESSIGQKDTAMIDVLLAPDFDPTELHNTLNAFFQQYEELSASADDVETSVGGETGTITFTLAVKGSQARVGAGADVTELEPISEETITVDLVKSGDLWLISGLTVQG